jgi:GntR family transcriptional repressor for pyruvate dehydrogenase complex
MVRRVVPFRAPLRRRIHESVAEQLRDAILDGRFAVGKRLPPERELALEFQVNRTAVREAIKVLEGLGLVRVRQGAGAMVQPRPQRSLSVLPHIIHRGGRTDARAMADVAEVLNPLFLEMARLAMARFQPAQLAILRALRAAIADETREREARFEAARQVFELVADMTANPVWQMLARKTTEFLRSEPMQQARRDLRRDPGYIVPIMDRCLAALEAGRPADALAALQEMVAAVGEATLRLRAGKRSRAAS